MRRVVSLYRSSVGKKILMAVTGIILFGFVVGHMAGNLKILLGPEAINEYGVWLREVGHPALPDYSFLWAFRIVLLASVLVHIVAAVQLWSMSSKARTTSYEKMNDLSFSYASRTMRWGGIIIALFVVYHILHFTTGTVHADFATFTTTDGAVHADVFHNFVVAFGSPLVYVAYLVAQAALCFHLYHGVWSLFQTLGLNHPKYNDWRRPVAGAFAGLVFVGFMLPPTLVLVGVIG